MTGLNGSHQPLIPFGQASFVVVERTTRLVADDPGFAGFESDVRSNLAGFERERLIAALDEIDEAIRVTLERAQAEAVQIDADRATALEANDAAAVLSCRVKTTALLSRMERESNAINDRRLPLIAPYVHAWNVYEPDGQGGAREVPPPRVSGAEAFAKITPDMVLYLTRELIQGYKSGKGLAMRTSDVSPPPGNVRTIGGPNVNPLSTPASRPKSSKR